MAGDADEAGAGSATDARAPAREERALGEPGAGAEQPARLAEGLELIGEYEGSGYREPPYIARRSDGQVVQLTRLLYLVAAFADGRRDYDEVALHVSEAYGRSVSADNVRFLVEQKLRPLGVLARADGTSAPLQKANAPLALRFRTAVIPDSVVQRLATLFKPLFSPLLVWAVLAAVAAVDIWFFFIHGVGPGLRSTIYEPTAMLLVLALVTLSAAFHECGHAAGCKYGGARPGVMGAGIYLVWPAFYTNVTDSYRLGKAGRLRTDLGGIYFNLLFVLATYAAYIATRFEPLLLVILVQHVEILRHFFPFVRLDGYYVFSDLTGVPDLFARMKPILRSLRPGRPREVAVAQLKPWVRWVVTAWVFTVIPLLLLNVVLIVIHLPRIAATTVDSFGIQRDRLGAALASGDAASIALSALQVVLVVLPPLGIGLMFARVARQLALRAWRATGDVPVLRTAGALATGAIAFLALVTWWPNGEYKPLQEAERLTYGEAVRPLAAVTSGRPALTPQREQELGGAPPLRGRVGAPPGAAAPEPHTGDRNGAEGAAPPSPSSSPSPWARPSPSPSSAPRSPSPSPSWQRSPSPSPSGWESDGGASESTGSTDDDSPSPAATTEEAAATVSPSPGAS